MTSPAAPRLAPAFDPALPGLADVLPPASGTAADDRRVRSVDWVPRRRCRVVHEIRSPDGTPRLVVSEVTPEGTAVRDPADDPALPGLATALDPAGTAHRLARICGEPVDACRVVPVSYRPGARAVVAYDLGTRTGETRLYAKLLAEGPDRYAAAAAAMAASARRRGEPSPVPEVVGVWPDLGAVVQRAAPGRGLSSVLRDESLPDGDRVGCAEHLGTLLARVHATPGEALEPWSAEDELSALEGLLAPTCHAYPAAGRSFAALVERLADTVPGAADALFSHGAFRTGQVMVRGGALSLLDLDTVSRADPARDAGNALAYLSWADVRGALRPGFACALQEAFLTGYADDRATLQAPTLAWWSAAAMAKIAGRRFRALATSEWRSVPALLTRAGTLLDRAADPGRPRPRPCGTDGRPVDPLDPVAMTEVLRREPSMRAVPDLRVVRARPLADAPGRRRVVRYEVAGLDTERTVPLVGKVYAGRVMSAIAHGNLRLLGDTVFAATPRTAVPRVVCSVPAVRAVLYEEVTGTPLDRLPADAGVRVAGLAAEWLARLHGSDAVLVRRLDLAHELDNVEQWSGVVGAAAPDARAAARELADRLSTAAADLPAVAEVPIHKDLHAGHVIAVRSGHAEGPDDAVGGVAVIDLDEARMGDPAVDVAHFTTYLDASADALPTAREVRHAFLSGYGPLPGPAPEQRLAFFAAYTSMKIAKQLVTGRGPVPVPSGAAGPATLLAVLRRGVACLAG